jgi:RHS repeat-associated protein
VTYPDGSEVTYDYSDDFTAKAIRWTKDAPSAWKNTDMPIVSYQASEAEDGDRLLLKQLGNGMQELYSWAETGELNEISVSKPDSKKDSKSNPILNLEYVSYPQSGLLKSSLRKDFRRNSTELFLRSFEYDDSGNLTTVEEKLNNDNGKHVFSYGANGSLVSDDLAQNYYEFANKNTAQLRTSPTGLKFDYDANRNIQAITSANESSVYDFDVEGRLLSASVTRGGRKTDTTFVYDHLGERLVKAVKSGAITTYVDPFFEFTLMADGSLQQTRYVWDAMGRVAAFTETVSKDRFLAGLATIPGKQSATGEGPTDPSGIPVVDTAFEKVFAGVATRMSPSVQAIAPLAGVLFATFFILLSFEKLSQHNAGRQLDNRLALSSGGAIYLHRMGSVSRPISVLVIVSFLGTLIAPSAMAALEAGDGAPKPDQVTFFHHDIRGSVLAVTDEEGNQTAAVNYQPYGEIDDSRLTNGNNNFRYKFAAMEYDETTGLYYDHARYYHPGIKRFLSTDLARQTEDPYSYTSGDPVNYTDPNGRMRQKLLLDDSSGSDNENIGMTTLALDQRDTIDDNASNLSMMVNLAGQTINPQYGTLAQPQKLKDPLDWVRYPTFFRMTYGVKKGHVAPGPVAQFSDQPTNEEIQEFNQQARGGFMQGWTRTGGYIQSIFSALLLAWWFPTSYTYANGGGTVHAGFWTDLGIYAMTVTAFSGYGKAYTANASAYWNNFMRKGATWKDYLKLSLRRVVHKAVVQVIAFSGITLFGRYARGYPVFDPDWNPVSEIKWLIYRNLIFSTFGSVLMLSYYLPTKPPSPTYDDELAENNYQNAKWGAVNNAWFLKRWYLKAAHMYRMFNGRKGFWAKEHPESKIRNLARNSWYAWYVTQMYVWYVIGSAAYYTGLATLLGTHPSLTKSDFLLSWRGNLAQVILSPAASPFAYINFWHRKSFTIVKKRSVKSPRTPKGSWSDWFWFKILGPVDGLRIAKFDDAAFMPKDDWVGEMRRLKELENIQGGDNDPINSNTKHNLPNPKGSYDEIESDSNEEQKEYSPNAPGGNESSQSNNGSSVE